MEDAAKGKGDNWGAEGNINTASDYYRAQWDYNWEWDTVNYVSKGKGKGGKAKSKGKSNWDSKGSGGKSWGKQGGKSAGKDGGKTGTKGKDGVTFVGSCWNCGLKGHSVKNCPSLNKRVSIQV